MLKPSITQLISYRRWLETLNKIQLLFSVPPYSKKTGGPINRKKNGITPTGGGADENKFENYIAASLHRTTTLYADRFGEKLSLHFVRTHDDAEVDFLICRNAKPWLLIEAKEGSPDATSAVHRFTRELGIPCAVVTRKKNICRKIAAHGSNSITAISWDKLGSALP